MRRKKFLFILALLCTIVQGAWAQNGIYCTASDKGRVVCTDGSIYDNVAAAKAANKTAVAKIIWVDESAKKGLALALQDDGFPDGFQNNINGANRCNDRNSSQPIVGATWKLASKDEWNTMINAAGGFASLRDGFGGVGGSNLSTQYSYSSSSSYNDSQYWAIHFLTGYWSRANNDLRGVIRACLSFNLLTLYTISNQSEWITFCNQVNSGDTFSDKYVKLTDWITTLDNMAGVDDGRSFQGIFDGNGHGLSANATVSENYFAPFRHVKNAVIKNLHVNGQIYTSAMKAAGFVGESHGNLTIENCCSSVGIHSSKSDDGTHGGFVATLSGKDNTIIIDNCIFDGEFTTTNGTVGCGGFIGWPVYNKPVIKNSIMKPSKVDAGMVEKTFTRWYDGYEPTITNCYFVTTDNLPTNQGTPAYASVPDGEICKKLTFPYITIDDVTIYSTASTVSGVETSYNLDNGVARIEPVLQAPGGNTTRRLGTDYTVTLDGNPVSQIPLFIKTKGSYTLILTGQGDYSGTKTFNITITGTKDYIPVSSDATLMTDGVYVVENDVSIGSRINISGNATLATDETQYADLFQQLNAHIQSARERYEQRRRENAKDRQVEIFNPEKSGQTSGTVQGRLFRIAGAGYEPVYRQWNISGGNTLVITSLDQKRLINRVELTIASRSQKKWGDDNQPSRGTATAKGSVVTIAGVDYTALTIESSGAIDKPLYVAEVRVYY